jgi:DNA-directed RNA polymerase specialized sigma24 family protein
MAEDLSPITSERLEKAAARLHADECEALRLAAGEHLSAGKIAERLGISAAEAEAMVASALLGLDRALRRQARPWWRFW